MGYSVMDVTVCILSYNRLHFLREAVASVLAQTRKPQRIAIFDNGSDPSVYEGMRDLLARGVEWVGSEKNQPALWNIKRAMQSVATEYMVVFHDDDRLLASYIEKQVAWLDSHPEVLALSCNGFYIDDAGARTGSTLATPMPEAAIEIFRCSGQVALKYANNSCIPFSPAMYRSRNAQTTAFRENFGKVLDATYFCDLADRGPIACQTEALYECRMHAGQDSATFPIQLLNRLEEFFASRRFMTPLEKHLLEKYLLRQHTARNLKMLFYAARRGQMQGIQALLRDQKFSYLQATFLVFSWTRRILFGPRH